MFDKLRKKGAEKKESTKKFFNLVLAKSAPDIKKSLINNFKFKGNSSKEKKEEFFNSLVDDFIEENNKNK